MEMSESIGNDEMYTYKIKINWIELNDFFLTTLIMIMTRSKILIFPILINIVFGNAIK